VEEITKNIDALQKTPGQILKTARENNGVSIAEVSQALLLNKSIINALEADDYSGIVAKVYAQGYLKSYAAYLKLPVSAVLESFKYLDAYDESGIEPIRAIRNNAETGSGSTNNINKLLMLLKNKKSIVFLAILTGLFCLVLAVIATKLASVKTSQEPILSTDNTTAIPVFPITVSDNLVSAPQVEQIEIPKDNKNKKKTKNKPGSGLKSLDEDPEDLDDDVAQ